MSQKQTQNIISDDSKIIFKGVNKKHKLYKILNKRELEYINITQKKKKKTEIYKVLQLLFTMFHILKLLHDIFIINPTNYISFNIHSQAIIHQLISHFIDLFQIF